MDRLLVLCPQAIRANLAAGLAAAGRSAEIVDLPPASGPRSDPFQLRERLGPLAAATGARAAIVVTSRRRGPARAVPGVVVGGVVVGLMQANRPGELEPWLAGLLSANARHQEQDPKVDGQILVAAMGKDVYLDIASGWLATLRAAQHPASDARADRTSRRALCSQLADGPTLVLYAGHGRARGWSGYQALRTHHVDAAVLRAPAHTVLAMACGTLGRPRNVVPFGSHMVATGRALAYVGAVGPITVEGGHRLGDLLVKELAVGRPRVAADLLRAVACAADRKAADALSSFRLVGDPLQRLPTARPPTAPCR